jgi:hypothetical protein
MQVRARSLRTALFATALMTAVAAPAAAAPATRTAPAAVAEAKPIAVLPSSSYGPLGVSSATLIGTASGTFQSWNNIRVLHTGRAIDRGPGFTRVTFKHYSRFTGRLVPGSTRTFVVDNGVIPTNYSATGNFGAILITTCKTGRPCQEMARIRT